jgi:hypothetical protein
MAEELPPEYERLYGLPLEDFVKERNGLARQLRQDGRGDEADQIEALRRPSVALWAVNQLARQRGELVETLLAAGQRLRGGDVRAADDVSRAVDRLVTSARDVLGEAGHAASDATLQRVAATLRAAVADDAHAQALADGRLTAELQPAGFEAMAALAGATAPPRSEKPAAPRRERDRRHERLREARDSLAEAKRRARELASEADRAERQAKRARVEADRARTEVERAEQQVARLRGRA